MMNRWTRTASMAVLMAAMLWMMLPAASRSQPAFTQIAKRMVEAMARGDFQTAVAGFDQTMQTVMPADKLKQVWSSLGTFQMCTGARETQEAGHRMVYVTCRFAERSLDMKVVVNADGKVGGLWFIPVSVTADLPYTPPAYVRKERFTERDVTIGAGENRLPGTLSVPVGNGPFPAVVLVHGSGPQDRNQQIGPNRPFQDIAWGLASRGIAVLRYDKSTFDPQGKARLAKIANQFTVKEEVVDDALAAVKLLRRTAKIDSNRVFVLGHSLGGSVIPRIGLADPRIAGLIMMAGCGTEPMEAMVRRQLTYIASLNGPITADVQKTVDEQAQAILRNAPASYTDDLRGYLPQSAAMAMTLTAPMLILHGARDYQATREGFDTWKQTLSGKANAAFRLYPDLNHLFMTGVGMATPGEYTKPGNVAEAVVNDIAVWVASVQRVSGVSR